jgi:ribosomal protein S27E
VETHTVAVETHGAVLDLQTELQRLGGLHLANAGEVRSLLEQVLMHLSQAGMTRGEVRPGNSCSIRGEDERRAVKALLARFRQLPPEEQRRLSALQNALGKLQVGAGDFEEAYRTFTEVVQAVTDSSAKAEAFYNAYLAALAVRRWDEALLAIRHAASLHEQRFAPFPMGKYVPVRILGAGGFGVAFLCRHNDLNAEMVVKAVRDDGLGRNVDDVLNEACLLNQVDHPCIIRLRDYGYMLPTEKARPYLVMDYFDGAPLQDFVREQALSWKDCLSVARLIAEGLQAAHQKGVLHRDVKPANVLVRRDGSVWQVKLIDFGLALRADAVSHAKEVPGSQEGTPQTSGGGGTLDYAAPEQLIPGGVPGPYSDVYGWAKTCIYGLFRTPHPLPKHWASISRPFAQLLAECLDENPNARPADGAAVIARLNSIAGHTWVGMATDWGKRAREQATSTASRSAGMAADWGNRARTALADFAKRTHGKIRFPCPKCQGEVSVEYDKAGTQLQCPNCGEQVQVPAAEGLALLLVKWVTEKAIAGVPPLLTPAELLADRYLKHHKFPNHGKRIDSLINWEATKNFTTGYMTGGLGGLLTLPVALPAAFAASWIIQARMVAAVARISGCDLRDDAVHTFIAACLVGDVVKDIAKPLGLQIGTGLTKAMISKVPGEVLIRINQMIGFRLITKAGEFGSVNLMKWLPVAGGIVGGSFDGYMCLAAGKRAKKLFYNPDSPPEPEQPKRLDV